LADLPKRLRSEEITILGEDELSAEITRGCGSPLLSTCIFHPYANRDRPGASVPFFRTAPGDGGELGRSTGLRSSAGG